MFEWNYLGISIYSNYMYTFISKKKFKLRLDSYLFEVTGSCESKHTSWEFMNKKF